MPILQIPGSPSGTHAKLRIHQQAYLKIRPIFRNAPHPFTMKIKALRVITHSAFAAVHIINEAESFVNQNLQVFRINPAISWAGRQKAYFTELACSTKRSRILAVSALVDVPLGSRIPLPFPVIIPDSYAQARAFTA